MKVTAILALFASTQSLLVIEPLPWADAWKELIIDEFEEVNHKQLIDFLI